ncbi:MAG TPA: 1,4-dihydroxy-2-naphthoate octaprenyltransferase, partial [Bifidobacterium pullorum]|nr:1,4-dihydroxy-2-naphthoate octaprenyltransferase [Bifidobacterium pullorum]
WLLAVGVCCLLVGWCYTGGRHPYGYAGLGELFVFVFFGLVAVLGTQFVLYGTVTRMGVVGAVQAGLLSCALLMVNNLRDVDADRVHGKRTLAVRLGERRARILTVVTYWVGVCPSMMLELALLAMFAIQVGHYPAAVSYGSGWVIGLTGAVSLILAMLNGCAILGRDHARALPLTSLSLLVCAMGHVGMAVL